ncbi:MULTISPECIES: sensor histidine kinase [Citromicrobium]|uniref:sensor histidine kinase n=1 Tax=Citromicrobium TaxID=72173 RepID=UPI0001DD0435|nr:MULTISPECIES: HWE histidine kinase domain-containing protein [Citromicrobium]ALG61940.1 histidine kinase [Citromicrobium sp. JL477]KPM15421.1 histidine kinase [Citromicrobium sp. JL31]KPM16326.1 histidine kinase [Citromicrobium sp. JL1351]KPM23965.1 histidine kinase [Citromicrobium sp. JL2201]
MNIDFLELAEASPNPYVLMDRDLRLVWMNLAYCAVTMRAREDIIDRKMFDAFPADPDSESYRQLRESLDHVLETGEPDEIALIRYDIARPDGGMDTRYWSATHTPLHSPTGETCYILQHTVDVTEMHKLRDEVNVLRRADAVQERNRSLERESQRLLEFFQQAPGFVAVLGGPTHVFQMANAAYLRLVGRDDIVGRTVAEALPEVAAQGFIETLDEVYRTGKAYIGRREPVLLDGDHEPAHARRVLNFIFQPISDGDGTNTGIIVQGADVTEEVEYEERQELLIQELNHRVKNTLAVVQSIAQQTFRAVPDSAPAMATFKARLHALAAAHGLLTESSWSPASVREIVELTVGATFGPLDDRVPLDGPDFLLNPEVALALTMIVHELTTNAIKYGALSDDAGRVHIDWSVNAREDCDVLSLTWRERGGPPVAAPSSEGFGTRLIRTGITSKRGTAVDLRFEPEGVVCALEVMLECGAHHEPSAEGPISSPSMPG